MSDRYQLGNISGSTVAVGRAATAWSAGAQQVSFAQLREALDVLDDKLAEVEQTQEVAHLRLQGIDLQRAARDDSTVDEEAKKSRWKAFAAAAAALVSATSIGVVADLAQITQLARDLGLM